MTIRYVHYAIWQGSNRRNGFSRRCSTVSEVLETIVEHGIEMEILQFLLVEKILSFSKTTYIVFDTTEDKTGEPIVGGDDFEFQITATHCFSSYSHMRFELDLALIDNFETVFRTCHLGEVVND